MDQDHLRGLLEQVRAGAVDVDAAIERVRHLPFEDWASPRSIIIGRQHPSGDAEPRAPLGSSRSDPMRGDGRLTGSVVGGLVAAPMIAVPASVGYSAIFQRLAALLGMLDSCASNVTVVNIDNGFGTDYAASLMNRL
jgi:NCAIR mutase (PurE)-related protein